MRKTQDRPTGYDWIVFGGWIFVLILAGAYTFWPRFTPGGFTLIAVGAVGAISTWPGRS